MGSGELAGTGEAQPEIGPETTMTEDRTLNGSVMVRQQSLPIPWQLAQTGSFFDEGNFAHPAEVTFSRILNFYRVRWSYEPTTFALAYTAEGQPSEMFTPDFYLPELNMYVELTTMRQRLVTRKNRKMRRLRELYPDIRIKLLYRRDCERLGDSYAESPLELGRCHEGRVLFGADQIRDRIVALADAIVADASTSPSVDRSAHDGGRVLTSRSIPIWQSADAPEDLIAESVGSQDPDDRFIVMSVDPGSALFAHHLAGSLEDRGLAIARDRVRLTRHRAPNGERRVKIAKPPRLSVAGQRVLLVADVVSTGLSHAYLTSWLQRRGAIDVQICTLLDRSSARLVDVPVRYAAFDAPNDLLVGFGLHLRRQFRHLPYIATLVTESIPTGANS